MLFFVLCVQSGFWIAIYERVRARAKKMAVKVRSRVCTLVSTVALIATFALACLSLVGTDLLCVVFSNSEYMQLADLIQFVWLTIGFCAFWVHMVAVWSDATRLDHTFISIASTIPTRPCSPIGVVCGSPPPQPQPQPAQQPQSSGLPVTQLHCVVTSASASPSPTGRTQPSLSVTSHIQQLQAALFQAAALNGKEATSAAPPCTMVPAFEACTPVLFVMMMLCLWKSDFVCVWCVFCCQRRCLPADRSHLLQCR